MLFGSFTAHQEPEIVIEDVHVAIEETPIIEEVPII